MRIPTKRASRAGFTLVELMVALVLAMVLVVAMLKMQGSLAQQTVRSSDTGLRDNESRAAVDLVTQDLSGAGFLFAGSQFWCNGIFAFNSGNTTKFYVHHPVDAAPAVAGAAVPFVSGLSMNYPPTSPAVPSDVLAILGSADSTDFSDTAGPIVPAVANPAYSPYTLGVVPLVRTDILTQGDMGIFQVTYGTPTSKTACFRVPMTLLGNAGGSANVTIANATYTPGGGFSGYASQLTAAGFAGTLSNAVIYQGQIVDMSATPTQQTTVYYVDKASSTNFPVLMRAKYSLATDTLVPGSQQAVAAGVVSLQVLFGVDPSLTGSVSAYQNAAAVTAATNWDTVRSVRVAVVSRSLNDDGDPSFATADPLVLTNGFASVPTTNFTKRRYQVNYIEIAARNTLWNTNAGVGGPP